MAKLQNNAIASLPSEKICMETLNLSDEHLNAVKIEWVQDHSEWKSDVERWQTKEERIMNPDRLKARCEKSGDNPELFWDTQWPEPEVTKWKEVYGVLRAEWFFGKTGGMKKLSSKVNGNHGIDSLFRSGQRYVIVESKCSADIHKYKKYKKLRNNSVRGYNSAKRKLESIHTLGKIKRHLDPRKLKKLKGLNPKAVMAKILNDYKEFKACDAGNSITLSIVQMSWDWVRVKINEMLCEGSDVENNGRALRKAWKNKERKIRRWFNYYATNPFYRLPGKYRIVAVRSAEFLEPDDEEKPEEKEFGWPDGRGEVPEFLCLDAHEAFNRKMRKSVKKFADKVKNIIPLHG